VRILALSTAIPFPPISGGKLRTFHLLRALAERHELKLVAFTYGEQPDSPPFPVQVIAVPWESPPLYRQMTSSDPAVAQRAADALASSHPEPWCVSWAESAAMSDALRQIAVEPFDLILLEGTPMARFLPELPSEVPIVLDFMDVYTCMALRQSDGKQGEERASAVREAERVRRFEHQAALLCDRCLAVSQEETQAVRDLFGIEHVDTIANGVDTSYFVPGDDEPEFASLLFTGAMSYRPNAEAVQHFAKQILPRIVRDLPEAKLHVVGAAPPKEVSALAAPHIAIHGLVPDMRVYHRQASVVVVPLLRGGGTKLKVLEAAAMGKAIVTTSIGAAGLAFRDGEDLIVADQPEEFADAVVGLARDRALQRKLGASARRIALEYEWNAIGQRLGEVIDSLSVQIAVR